MEQQIKSLIADVEKMSAKAKKTLTEYPAIAEQLDIHLQRVLNFLNFKAGNGGEIPAGETFGPITKLKGKDWKPGDKVEPVKEKEVIKKNETDELREEVDALEKVFMTLESSVILDEHGDMAIRGVAKRAGLPVTEEDPKKIDTAYIDLIKATIKNKEELNDL